MHFSVALSSSRRALTLLLSLLVAGCGTEENSPKAVLVLPEKVIANVPAYFDASGSRDQETGIERYRFEFGDGSTAAVSTNALAQHAYQKAGVYDITLTVYDGDGRRGSTTQQVEVASSAPAIRSVSLGAGPYYEDSTIEAKPKGWSDNDGDEPLYAYQWYVNGAALPKATAPTLTGKAFDHGDEVFVRVTPVDANDTGPSVESAVITISNSLPAVTAAHLASTVVDTHGTLALAGTSGWSDVDDDSEGYLYQWYVNGLPVVGQTGASLAGAFFEKGDLVYLQVTPYDGFDAGLPIDSSVVTIGNIAPVVDAVEFGTGPFFKGDTLIAAVQDVNDADAMDTLSVEYRWFVNGVSVAASADLSSGFAKGNTVTVAARAFDGIAYGPWVTAPSVVIQNRKPVITSLHINADPSPATKLSTLSFSAVVYDPDGDEVTFIADWLAHGTDKVGYGDSFRAGNQQVDDIIGLEIRPFDGTDVGALSGTQVTILNNAPTPPGITFKPAHYWHGDSLYAELTTPTTDADGHTITYNYQWLKNGVVFAGATTAVSAMDLEAGDVWDFSVTASDGYITTSAATATFTVPEWATSSDAALAGKYYSAAVWTGREMIVWGGSDAPSSGNLSNEGARFNPVTNSWLPTSASNLSARYGHRAVWTGKEMIIWGGYGVEEGSRYNPSTDSWTLTPSSGLAARAWHTAVWTGREMIVWGGYHTGAEHGDGSRYEPTSNTWSPMAATTTSARHNHSAVWTGREMVVWGGWNGSAVVATGARYFPDSDSWSAVTTSNAPSPRSLHSAVWSGKEMLVLGGTDPLTSTKVDGHRYDPVNDAWSPMSSSGLAPRINHSALWTGDEMIVFGGTNGATPLNDGKRYDPRSDTWAGMTSPTRSRNLHAAAWTGREMIVWGGNTAAAADAYRRYRGTESWAPVTTSSAPSGRFLMSAVWTGSEIIYWGGTNNAAFFNEGYRYNPATDTWVMTSASGLSGRVRHTAVWTGREMLVWGGETNLARFNDGSRYDPSTDTWAATGPASLAPRSGHTAVWTGREMIVWGGLSSSGQKSDGGQYDPVSGAWSWPSSPGAFSGRHDHSAVWTGKEMLVWGGESPWGIEATGRRYDPASDTWSAMSAAPISARRAHSAVWTGSEMLIWGGMGTPANGARYRPDDDSWKTMATSGLTSRNYHQAVWNGSEMMVWGGSDKADGGRYSPSGDVWRPLSVSGLSGRAYHSAVWTGREMVVWGGLTGTTAKADGARWAR